MTCARPDLKRATREAGASEEELRLGGRYSERELPPAAPRPGGGAAVRTKTRCGEVAALPRLRSGFRPVGGSVAGPGGHRRREVGVGVGGGTAGAASTTTRHSAVVYDGWPLGGSWATDDRLLRREPRRRTWAACVALGWWRSSVATKTANVAVSNTPSRTVGASDRRQRRDAAGQRHVTLQTAGLVMMGDDRRDGIYTIPKVAGRRLLPHISLTGYQKRVRAGQ